MNNTDLTRHTTLLLNTGNLLRILTMAALALVMTGCGQLGQLLSNDQVADADNDQVVFLGDSIFALSGGIQDELEGKAGETFRRYTVSGAELTGGVLAPSVVEQLDTAVNDNPDIDTLVTDGGGNDILIPAIALDPHHCKTHWYQFGRLSDSCKSLIDDVYVDAVDYLNGAAAAGVDKAIFLGYYYTKNGLFRLESMKEAVDYGNQSLARACANSVLECTFVDPRSSIVNSDIIFDGIHPSDSGSRKIANLIWPKLQPLL
ncbi:SGNH/GDSL hydrolase family protein [Marinobacter sp. M1N3S26]|uniref:SGNH/GDSL hydrolase family protein n=1 Tax=unclassified Marinobacter TaxID=83889 RepID=UPI00387B29FA